MVSLLPKIKVINLKNSFETVIGIMLTAHKK